MGAELPYNPEDHKHTLKEYSWISPNIVEKAIRESGPHKAPGPDQLKPIVLQNLPEKAIRRITVLFKACIQLEYTPHLWRRSI